MSAVRLICLLSVMCAVITLVLSASRQPTQRDHLLCRIEYKNEWETVLQETDPYAIMEAFYRQDGTICKTACRIRSSNPALNRNLEDKNSALYEACGPRKYCVNGECKLE